jgi:hypothetical protein
VLLEVVMVNVAWYSFAKSFGVECLCFGIVGFFEGLTYVRRLRFTQIELNGDYSAVD